MTFKNNKKKKSFLRDEKGQMTYIMLFIIIFVVLLFAFAIVIPIMQAMVIGFYAGTSNAINPVINKQVALILDANLAADINASVQAQNDMQTTTIDLFSLLATYAGIITILVVFFAWLLIGRKNVEAGGLA